jgi:hypothetical protein
MAKLYVQGVVQWQRERNGYYPIMLVSVEGEEGRVIQGLTKATFGVSVKSFPNNWSWCHVWNVEASETTSSVKIEMTGYPALYGFYQLHIGPPFPYTSWKAASWMVDNSVFSIRVSSPDQGYGQALASNFTPAVLPRSLFTPAVLPRSLLKILARISR